MARRRIPLTGGPGPRPPVATTSELDALIAAGSPVAIGVSGGKDSVAAAFATAAHLDAVRHAGPRLLIHADLGVTEWQDSLPTCERLAARLGYPFQVVRRPQGDMMERWEQRWRDNLRRWLDLSCVKLILPWSTPAMRFCTAELKVDQITRHLAARWPGAVILNVTGIRREESTQRAKTPVFSPQPKLTKVKLRTTGFDWCPIVDWSIEHVYEYAAELGFDLHEAYTVFGASRVSCVWCILATIADHLAGAKDERNHALARRMVDLEIASTFAFQGDRWLGDTLIGILDAGRVAAVREAKARARRRETAEARIPEHLLYVKGWPTCVPTAEEATLLAAVRFAVADALNLKPTFTTPDEVRGRYEELMAAKLAA